jgi:cytochrome c1
MISLRPFLLALFVGCSATIAVAADPWLTLEGEEGPGKAKQVVLISGDEEYRSEEGLTQLAKILAKHHGFTCTVLYAIDPATGETNTRPGEPTDTFPMPVPNASAAAAANNNAIPPDLSLMTKARADGSNYVYDLLTGYEEADPEKASKLGFETPAGLYFNKHFPNVNIAMAPPLAVDGQVTYADGTNATIPQMAEDVAAFLTWTAEPSLVERKQTGWVVLGFLLFATTLAFLSYKQIWAGLKPKKA